MASTIVSPVGKAQRFAPLCESTPDSYRQILLETDEKKLLASLTDKTSYPMTVVIHHRLAQLRDTHAVSGILSSSGYTKAKKKADSAAQKLKSAQKTLAIKQAQTQDPVKAKKKAESERDQIESDILGYEWLHQLCLGEREAQPEWKVLAKKHAELVKKSEKLGVKDTKSAKEADKEILKAVLRHGHASAQAAEARVAKDELLAAQARAEPIRSQELADLEKEMANLTKKLLGAEKRRGDERYFSGGLLDMEPIYEAHREALASDIEAAILERAAQLSHGDHDDLRRAVSIATAEYEDASQDLAVHEAAINAAKARAKAARERVLSFEPQTVDSSMAEQIKSRPGHVRAIFADASVFEDHIVYAEWKRGKEATTKKTTIISIPYGGIPMNIFVIPKKLHPADKLKWEGELSLAISAPVVVSDTAKHLYDEIENHMSAYAPTIKAQALEESWERLIQWCVERTSPIKPRQVWTDGKSDFHVFGDVSVKAESRVLKILHEAGAKVTKNVLEVPEYSSWASIDPGKRLTLELDGGRIHYVPHYSLKPGKKETHGAPFSERGIIHVESLTPAAATKELSKLGLLGQLVSHIPYDLVYRGSHRLGRVTPIFEPFASGRAALALPEGHMVIHGLTGIGGFGAVSRLKTIIETGGLKSIAERRRLNITVQSMSPLGDIASGTDTGVPTKFGASTTYGGTIFFGMKPDILHRRDLWFSDRDFGGGHSRYEQYTAYAKKLGQEKIYLPCPVEGRQKHIDTGLGSSNEAYFRHEISWNDVDTLFVASNLHAEVAKVVESFKKEGLLPEHVRVESFGETQGEDSLGDAWEIDATSGEVIYFSGTGYEGQAKPHDANAKIQARAKEIMRNLS